jgi:predicted transcriptional regulator
MENVVCHKMPQRDRYDILRSILEIIYNGNVEPRFRNNMNKTRVGRLAGLTFFQTTKYLKVLVGIGLLATIDYRPHSYYEITEKGYRCLELFSEIDADLKAAPSY